MRYNYSMANRFTDEQLKAITTLDKSVLVSAAAGSGKTSVLVERIIRIILEGRANVDEMLVVTFTKAAASEMRSRLTSAIKKRMEEVPEDAPRMKDQLSRMYRAYITTIDSFAMRVIKEFFHRTDLEPGFSVGDEVRCEILKREAVAELFEDGFEDDGIVDGGSFRAFLRLYSEERSDEAFMKNLISAYDELRSMPDYFNWAYSMAEQLKVSEDSFEGSVIQKMMLDDAVRTFGGVAESLRSICGLFDDAGIRGMYDEKLGPQAEAVRSIYEQVSAGKLSPDIIDEINSIPATRLVAKKAQKEAYESIKAEVKALNDALKDEIKNFRNRYLMPDFKTRLDEMNATYGYTVYYLGLLQEFERRYEEKKREKKLIDFADMEHIAVRILADDEASEAMRKRFNYIFVDEYQDTNNIQETLIQSVARPGNVFRVGDVKQCIYKFRQAEPGIFTDLYRRYKAGLVPEGTAIDLGSNFRSNDATIRYINHVFSHIMDGYDEDAMLHTGLSVPEEYDFRPEVHLLLSGSAAEDDEEEPLLPEAAEEIEDLTKEEAEAEYIADLAKSIIGTEFYDTRIGEIKKAEARDIVILFRAVRRRGEVMSRALRSRAIEAHVEEADEYFDTIEIGVALNLLSCIDNMKRDVPLISVLHSEVFGFSPGELARVRTAYMENDRKDGARAAYWKAFEWYAENGPEGSLREKAEASRAKLLEWRMLSRMLPLADFVWKVLIDSGYYRMAGAMPEGSRRQANLRTLADKAVRFSRENIATLSSFIGFINVMKEKEVSTSQTTMVGRDDDVVRISTIHKSKGLEFPFVIVGGLGHRFRTDNNEKNLSFDSAAGIGLPYVDPSRRYWRSTLMQRAINAKSRQDAYSEELRLLYVAMTRARNKLIMVGTCKDEESLSAYTANPNCFLKAMRDVLKTGFNTYHVSPLQLTKAAAEDTSVTGAGTDMQRPLTAEEQAIYDEIDRRFRYRYPDEDLLTEKAKWSVSAIRKEELEEERAKQREVVVMSGDEVANIQTGVEKRKRASAADIGTAYHRIMEFLDFTKACGNGGIADTEYIGSRARMLNENGAIDDDVFSELDLGRIAAFFESSIGRRAVSAAERGSLKREKPFTLRTERNGRSMLVQGVIDCCFEEDGRMVLIDYKSSYIRQDRPRSEEHARIKEEYKVQIELYSEAVRKGTGMEVGEAYLYLFTTSEAVAML